MYVELDTFAEAQTQIVQLATEAFARHQIEVVHQHPAVTVYRCGRVDSGIYGFRLVFLPFTIVFYGDIGEAILRMSDTDSLGWLRGAVKSTDYLIEKVRPQPAEAFYKADAHAWLDERKAELAESNLAFEEEYDLREVLDDDDTSSPEFARGLSEAGLLDRRVPGVKPSSATLWMVEALRWFVTHIDVDMKGKVTDRTVLLRG